MKMMLTLYAIEGIGISHIIDGLTPLVKRIASDLAHASRNNEARSLATCIEGLRAEFPKKAVGAKRHRGKIFTTAEGAVSDRRNITVQTHRGQGAKIIKLIRADGRYGIGYGYFGKLLIPPVLLNKINFVTIDLKKIEYPYYHTALTKSLRALGYMPIGTHACLLA
jgi:hypothetical protein